MKKELKLVVEREKTVSSVKRLFRVYDVNDNVIYESENAKDVVDKFNLASTSYLYAFKNSGLYFKPNKKSDDKIMVEYIKEKVTRTIIVEEPFIIPEHKRETIVNLPGEEWKVIPGVPACNYASSMGRLKVVDVEGNERLSTMFVNKNRTKRNYSNASIVVPNGKNYYVRASRAIAKAFLDPNFPLKKKSG